ncbi:MAG TPA: tetratricopeptide repeat protein [Burkholderiaceae bacterium]|jgi:Flp pilus assembly protein TadD
MRETLETLFHAAKSALAQNDTRTALTLAHKAWATAPHNADCCNLVGVCAIALADGDAAERCWLQAIELAPHGLEAHFNLAQYYLARERYNEAEHFLRRIVALAPDNAKGWARLAAILASQKRTDEAVTCYRKAVEIDTSDGASHGDLGLLLGEQRQFGEAVNALRCSLALRLNDPVAHTNLGVVLAKMRRYDEAESCYRTAIRLQPSAAAAHANLALLLEAVGRLPQAEGAANTALALAPESPAINGNLGNLLLAMGRSADAEAYHRKALALAPESAVAHSNLGVLLAYMRRDNEAEQHLRLALSIDGAYQLARLNLALLLLSQGRLGEGWQLHEARYHADLPDPDAAPPTQTFPQWQGESLHGKSLLLWPEQGDGDMIQFCRYLPLLKKMGATRIDLVCRAPLVELMRTLEGVDRVAAIEESANLAFADSHDYWTLPMSLPLHCKTEVETIPAIIPYLFVPAGRHAKWDEKLPSSNGKMRIGMVWRGNPRHANDANRSLHDYALLEPLWEVQHAQFLNLQYGRQPDFPPHVTDLGAEIADFADTAAIIERLDLLITVDTAAAHVAGALGKPCWVILPALRTDWRWLRARSDSPWYPGTMRLYRQGAQEDWRAVIDRLAADLRAFCRH